MCSTTWTWSILLEPGGWGQAAPCSPVLAATCCDSPWGSKKGLPWGKVAEQAGLGGSATSVTWKTCHKGSALVFQRHKFVAVFFNHVSAVDWRKVDDRRVFGSFRILLKITFVFLLQASVTVMFATMPLHFWQKLGEEIVFYHSFCATWLVMCYT